MGSNEEEIQEKLMLPKLRHERAIPKISHDRMRPCFDWEIHPLSKRTTHHFAEISKSVDLGSKQVNWQGVKLVPAILKAAGVV